MFETVLDELVDLSRSQSGEPRDFVNDYNVVLASINSAPVPHLLA